MELEERCGPSHPALRRLRAHALASYDAAEEWLGAVEVFRVRVLP